ncbi:MAG: glycosyltransferase family 2 protein [Candidatus Limnocylindria bacterium]
MAESDMSSRATAPEVSVVIPTRARPQLLARALRSVSEQTFRDFEVVVVVDGPDSSTEAILSAIDQPPLRVVVNPESVGGGEARNIGVRTAIGRWIAFLDDDDEWMPHKLARQLTDLRLATGESAVGMSQLITRSPAGDYIGPKQAPRRGEPFSDYLFVRSGWFKGGGRVQTSTLLVPRDLMIEIPFDAALPRYQETDWILRVAASGATIVMTMEPLSIWYVEDGRATITSSFAGDWRFALEWIRQRRHLMTRRAYGSLMLIRVGGLAAAVREPRGALAAWREAWRHGSPSARDVAIFAGKWMLTPRIRSFLRSRLAADRPSRA